MSARRAPLFALVLALGCTSSSLAQEDGGRLFADRCAACHQADGRGVPGVYPPLADRIGRFAAIEEGRAYLARVLINGLFGAIRVEDRPYNGLMPPAAGLRDTEIAAVLNYVLTELSPKELPADFAPLTAAEVAGYREPKASPTGMRKEREALLEELGGQASAGRAIPRITGVAEDFSRQCQGCHGASGMGAHGAVPRFRNFVGYFTHVPEGRDYLMRVPGVVFAPIDDARLAAVLNWTLETFSSEQIAAGFQRFTAAEVGRARQRPLADVRSTRKRLLTELRDWGLIQGDDDGVNSAAFAKPE